ncbi:DUF4251 domain-containing protein [Wenyingzhuangia sp. chi5]|uniref:DUF4251 domain-containing protein n=1 Tax=Wenyingzhuangia gilva TaxID=3057677 RepID=A0ABT8VUQ1_9FLAO|nr:DUF4251 domain-containing protein [Wenyingzhuangia sp. chi5]MDO3695705.1 DUF4251 domain-containing protein [Wenyingzhuangia sp. chi5]
MKKLRILIASSLLMVAIISCSSSKKATIQAQINTLDSLVLNQNFTIISSWARPQVTNAMQQVMNSGLMPLGSGAGSVSLIGNSNFLTIAGDSISSHLPYYGERQMNVNYGGGDSAIKLKGLMKDYKVTKTKDHSYRIDFTAKNESNLEVFTVSIKLYSNLQSDIFINSTSRFPISYRGEIKKELDTTAK